MTNFEKYKEGGNCSEIPNNSDCISRQAAIDAINDDWEFDYAKDRMIELSAQQEHKTGYLILLDDCSNSGYYCSSCQKKLVKEGWSNTVKKIKFCPNCGVKLVGEQI